MCSRESIYVYAEHFRTHAHTRTHAHIEVRSRTSIGLPALPAFITCPNNVHALCRYPASVKLFMQSIFECSLHV